MSSVESAILVFGIFVLAGVFASRFSDTLGVPSLLLFLAVGMLAGSEGIGGIRFDSATKAQAVGTVALVVILFAGGLDTKWSDMRPVLLRGMLLSTLGVCLTTLLLGTFAWVMLGTFTTFDVGPTGLTWIEALLLAAVVSSTDAAAVFSIFRTRQVRIPRNLRCLLELESGSNDPMAVLLTTALLGGMTQAEGSKMGFFLVLLLQFALGGTMGVVVGFLGAWLTNRIRLATPGLYPILALSLGLVVFGAAEMMGGNGFLAVYTAGVVIGNRVKRFHETILSFHEGLSWLTQICMFIVLGLLVRPRQLLHVSGVATAMALFLMFVARPVSVAACLLPFRPKRKELAYVSWVGLRGAVPIILATFPASYGIPEADGIFNVVFFVVIASVLLQGLTLAPCARWLGVAEKEPEAESKK
ncbi:MAG: potassium/proton antiporter [Phycisphaerae bacterium]|nr:potassium/proton antiporter [Phycisphaerae bacterium]